MSGKALLLAFVVLMSTGFSTLASASERAANPNPPDGAENVTAEAMLKWSPGDRATLHHIFLSTDYNAVTDRTSYQGNVHGHDNCSYDRGPLLLGQTYYWTVYEQFAATITRGQIWSFTVSDDLIVDDMESYEHPERLIWDIWVDGCGDANGTGGNGTGSCIWLESETVESGMKSMLYAYKNDASRRRRPYSEAKLTFDSPRDWTASGAKVLGLSLYGDADNDVSSTEQMYVGLRDGLGRYAEVRYGDNGEDMGDLKVSRWQEWNIPLSDFGRDGVDLTGITTVLVGLGDRSMLTGPGGWGLVYIDDIRLSLSGCVRKYAPMGDLSGNCVVDLADIKIMAGEWLHNSNMVADLDLDSRVDFEDYALLADGWLEEILWPQ
ncbi:MAG: hypothetical protein ACYTBJ_12770 [Planctomycetota bacterium]|jgi:hypothetical protein